MKRSDAKALKRRYDSHGCYKLKQLRVLNMTIANIKEEWERWIWYRPHRDSISVCYKLITVNILR